MSDSSITTEATDPLDTALRRGMRTEPLPAGALARIKVATEAQWRSAAGIADRRRHWQGYAAAAVGAMLLLVSGWIVGMRAPVAPLRATIGHLERIDYPGAVEQHSWSRDRSIANGDPVFAGQQILVRGGARIALATAGSLRLAAGTDIQIKSDQLIRLDDGDIYVDIPPNLSGNVRLAILTPAGTFTHLGTQFQLAVHGGETQLRVREGQVRLHSAVLDLLSGPGTELSIDRDGNATRKKIATAGADWVWTEVLAASFDIENQSLADFLHYIARETGRTLVFSDMADEQRANTTILHGSIQRLTAEESLSAVMATTSLRFTLNGDSIRIDSSANSGTDAR